MLYTDYIYFFQIAGLVLLVAMIGAIVLTLRHKAGVKRQDISAQVARTPATAIEIRKVAVGPGHAEDRDDDRSRPLPRPSRRSCSRSACSASS